MVIIDDRRGVRVQRLALVGFVAISSLRFERVAPRTDIKFARDLPRRTLSVLVAGSLQQQLLWVVKISRACTIDDSLGPPVLVISAEARRAKH